MGMLTDCFLQVQKKLLWSRPVSKKLLWINTSAMTNYIEKYLSQYPKLSFYHANEQWLHKTIHQNDNKPSLCIKVVLEMSETDEL